MKSFLFKELMLNQTLLGNKTNTRRLAGLEKVNDVPEEWDIMSINKFSSSRRSNDNVTFLNKPKTISGFIKIHCKPKYLQDDIIYCKENYFFDKEQDLVIYQKDIHPDHRKQFKWNSKLMMPAKYARTFVKCIGWDVQRLYDISTEDAIAEGIELWEDGSPGFYKLYFSKMPFKENGTLTAGISFISLFSSINGEELTNKNPWVFVYRYELLDHSKTGIIKNQITLDLMIKSGVRIINLTPNYKDFAKKIR